MAPGDLGDHGRFSDPSLLVMSSLAEGPKHGYAITKDIQRFAGVTLGPGTLYGALARLQHQGLIEALPADDRRRPYRLSERGQGAGRPAGEPAAGGRHRPAAPGPGVAGGGVRGRSWWWSFPAGSWSWGHPRRHPRRPRRRRPRTGLAAPGSAMQSAPPVRAVSMLPPSANTPATSSNAMIATMSA